MPLSEADSLYIWKTFGFQTNVGISNRCYLTLSSAQILNKLYGSKFAGKGGERRRGTVYLKIEGKKII